MSIMAANGNKSTNSSLKGKSLTTGKPQKAISLIPQGEKGLKYLSFSFIYCDQQDYFGYGDQDASWFATLQDRLKDLSGKTSAILESPSERDAYRLHPINWKAKNCPISINDLKSVPKVIKDNAESDFFWQFQLSKGNGRVVGFFNEDSSIFYIVLLDPKHNIQPSKDYGYQVDDTSIALTEYERINLLITDIEKEVEMLGNIGDIPERLCAKIRGMYLSSGVFYANIDIDLKSKYSELIENGLFQKKFEEFLLDELSSEE